MKKNKLNTLFLFVGLAVGMGSLLAPPPRTPKEEACFQAGVVFYQRALADATMWRRVMQQGLLANTEELESVKRDILRGEAMCDRYELLKEFYQAVVQKKVALAAQKPEAVLSKKIECPSDSEDSVRLDASGKSSRVVSPRENEVRENFA